jgi:putative peptidoglycan lipid II flippase
VVGAVLGQVLLHRRLGRLGTVGVLGALARMALAAVLAALAASGLVALLDPVLDGLAAVARAWVELAVAAGVGVPVAVAAMLLLRVPELAALRRRRPRATGRA